MTKVYQIYAVICVLFIYLFRGYRVQSLENKYRKLLQKAHEYDPEIVPENEVLQTVIHTLKHLLDPQPYASLIFYDQRLTPQAIKPYVALCTIGELCNPISFKKWLAQPAKNCNVDIIDAPGGTDLYFNAPMMIAEIHKSMSALKLKELTYGFLNAMVAYTVLHELSHVHQKQSDRDNPYVYLGIVLLSNCMSSEEAAVMYKLHKHELDANIRAYHLIKDNFHTLVTMRVHDLESTGVGAI